MKFFGVGSGFGVKFHKKDFHPVCICICADIYVPKGRGESFFRPTEAVHPASRQGSRWRALAAARRAAEKKMNKAGWEAYPS